MGREQHRALRAALLLAQPHILDGEAEEAGKADGLYLGVHRLQCPAEDLGAHVDAEGGLRPFLCGRRGGFVRGQVGDEAALIGFLKSALQEQFPGKGGFGLPTHLSEDEFMFAPSPGLGHALLLECIKQHHFPGQTNGEEFGQAGVLLAVEFGLPQIVAGVGSPAAHSQQQAMQVGVQPIGGDGEPVQGRFNQRGGVFGQALYQLAEVAHPGHFGRAIQGEFGAPGGVGAQVTPRRGPIGLSLIEVGGGPARDRFGDEESPIVVGALTGGVGHGGQHLIGKGCLAVEGKGFQRGHVLRRAGDRRLFGQCCRQIAVGDASTADGFGVEGVGGGHLGPGTLRHDLGGLFKRVIGQTQEGIHRYKIAQRPQRRNAAASPIHSGVDLGGGVNNRRLRHLGQIDHRRNAFGCLHLGRCTLGHVNFAKRRFKGHESFLCIGMDG